MLVLFTIQDVLEICARPSICVNRLTCCCHRGTSFFFLLPSEFEYCLPQLAWEKGFYVVVQNSNTANTLWRRGIYLNVITLKIYAQ
jgi:hypothetical protein